MPLPRSQRLPAGLVLLFCGALAAQYWILGYRFVLQYETPACFFLFTREFLAQWLDHPGGLLLYAGRFLRQMYHYPWLGALVAATAAAAVAVVLHRIRQRLSPDAGLFHSLFPAAALLVVHSVSTLALGYLAIGAAYLGYLHLPHRRWRPVVAATAVPLVYLAVGGYTWVLVAWVLWDEWLDRPARPGLRTGPAPAVPPPASLLICATAVLTPLAAYRWAFQISWRAAWLYPADLPVNALDHALVAYLVTMPLWPRLPLGERLSSLLHSARGQVAQAAVFALGVAALTAAAHDPASSQLATYHRLHRDGRWDAILRLAREHPPHTDVGQFYVNRALYEKGRLLEEMFHYPQPWGTRGLIVALADPVQNLHMAMHNSDLYYAMGHVNAAYRQAYNQVNMIGRTYDSVRRLVETTTATGSHAIAAKYIELLDHTLFHRDFARRYRQAAAEGRPATPHQARLASLQPALELDLDLGEVAILLSLIDGDPRNRMALEYLVAWCLLDKVSLSLVAGDLGRVAQGGYTRLPVHLQEAVHVWESIAGQPVDRRGLRFDRRVTQRFTRFGDDSPQHYSGPAGAAAFARSYRGTYMYYYAVLASPPSGTPGSSWVRLGNEYRRLGRLDDAASLYRQALLRNPQATEARLLLARALASRPGDAPLPPHLVHGLDLASGAAPNAGRPAQTWNLRSH